MKDGGRPSEIGFQERVSNHSKRLRSKAVVTSGVPSRPTDLRRAISNAYYGLFHFAITAAADMVLGAANQATARYALVYRSVDHAHLRNLCDQVRATNPQKVALVPVGGFGSIADFARITLNLYELGLPTTTRRAYLRPTKRGSRFPMRGKR